MKHRALSILLALTFLLSVFMFCTTAFAATGAQDGVSAELTTDKTDYVAGESINVTLDVENTSICVNNIRTELIIPEGVTLEEGVLKNAAELAAGENVQYTYVLSVPAVKVPATQAPTTQAPTTQAPTTGDDNAPQTRDVSAVIYGTLAVLSLAGLIALTFGSKLLKQRWFVLIICGALLLGSIGPVAASAAATEKTFEVTEAITIDGAAAEVKAVVTYDLVADEVVYKADGEVKWSHVGEMGYYTPSGVTYQGVTTTEKNRVEIEAPYYAMLFGSAEGKAGKYDPTVMFNADAEQTVLIGRTDNEASLKALELIDPDEWIIALVDDKIVVTGWYDAATAAAVDALAELVNVDAADVTLTLPIVGKMDYAHGNLPAMTAGTFLNGMDSERGAVVLRYNDITEADFNAYAEDLVAAGYSLYQENKLTNLGDVNNISATYVKGEDVVTIIYLPYVIEDATDLPTNLADAQKRSFRPDGTEMRIILQSTAQLIPNEEANVYEDLGITPKMHNVNLYNNYADGNDIGQCTIYTLADGSFLVWDGGYGADAEQLYRALKYFNERPDGKIVVAGWFFTHDHGDHTNAIATLAGSEYAKEITIEKVILNHAADVENWYSLNDPLGNMYGFGWAGVYDNIENVVSKFAQGEDYQLIVPHFGQVMNIRNANIEVLFAGEEDAFPVLINNDNACSLVTMVTFDDEEVDDRILLLGDHALDATYNFVFPYLSDGPMHCDIIQTAHHGLGGGTSKLYPICGGPETAIWCTTWRSANGEVTGLQFLFDRSQNAALRDSVKVDVMCDEYVHTLELPFNADEDEVIRTKLGTYKTKFQDCEMTLATLGVGRFGNDVNKYLEATVDYLLGENADADVLVLNSVRYLQADGVNVVETLVEAMDYPYYYYAPAWNQVDGADMTVSNNGTYGNLILSRYPILNAENLVYHEGTTADSSNEGRSAGHVILDVEGKSVDVYFTEVTNANNWAEIAEVFQPENDIWFIMGIGKNDVASIQSSLGDETVHAAVADHTSENIYSNGDVTFVANSKQSVNEATGCANMDALITATATFSLYTAPEASDAPIRQAFVNWWVNSWGQSYSDFEKVVATLKEVNPAVAAFHMVNNEKMGMTEEQVKAELGYPYAIWVPNNANASGQMSGHWLVSHYPLEDLGILEVSNGSDDAADEHKQPRIFGHALVTINGTEIDIWYGSVGPNAPKQVAKLEAAVNATATETGRPFIVSTNDAGWKDLTSFAGYEVQNYWTSYETNVLISKGKVTVTGTELVDSGITWAGVDKMNVIDLDVQMAPAILNWWINKWGGDFSKFESAVEIMKEQNLPIVTLQQISNNLLGITHEQVAQETGYEYFYAVDKVHVTGTTEINHMILSHYPIEVQEDIVLVDYTSGSEGRKFGHVIVDINGTKTDVYFGAVDYLSTEHMAALEAVVAKFVNETGRPFIVSANDMPSQDVTSFAGVEVYNYRTDYVSAVLVSKGALNVTETETVTTPISAGGIDKLNIVRFETTDGGLTPGDPFVPPVEPEPEVPVIPEGTEPVTLKVLEWWCNFGGGTTAGQVDEIVTFMKNGGFDVAVLTHWNPSYFGTEKEAVDAKMAEFVATLGYEHFAYVTEYGTDGTSPAGYHVLLSKYPITEAKQVSGFTASDATRAFGKAVLNVNGLSVDAFWGFFGGTATDEQRAQVESDIAAARTSEDFIFLGGQFRQYATYAGENVSQWKTTGNSIVASEGITMANTKTIEKADIGPVTVKRASIDAPEYAELTVYAPKAEEPATTATLNVAVLPASRFGAKFTANKDAIIAAIKSVNTDVLAITQIDEKVVYPNWWNNTDVATQIIEGVKDVYPYAYFAPAWITVEGEEGAFGHLILSKYEIKEYETIELVKGVPYTNNGGSYSGGSEGRAAGRVLLDVKGVSVDVFFLHTGDKSNWDVLAPAILKSEADAWIAMGYMNYAHIEESGIEAALGGMDINAAFGIKYNDAWNFINIISGPNAAISNVVRETATFGSFGADPLSTATVTIAP